MEEEEEEEEDGRSERTVNTAAATELEEDREERDSIAEGAFAFRRLGADLGGAESPDHSFSHRSPFQVGRTGSHGA